MWNFMINKETELKYQPCVNQPMGFEFSFTIEKQNPKTNKDERIITPVGI